MAGIDHGAHAVSKMEKVVVLTLGRRPVVLGDPPLRGVPTYGC